MAGVCMFCQSNGKLTKEHVWPDWMRRVLPIDPSIKRVHEFTRTEGGSHHTAISQPYSGDFGCMKLKVVCKPCNSGWMSRLQNAAKPVLSELVAGKWPEEGLDPRLLSMWCVMSAMVIEMGNPRSVFTKPAVRKRLVDEGAPAYTWVALVGTGIAPGLSRQAWSRKAEIMNPAVFFPVERMSVTTIVAGKLIFQVLGAELWSDQRERMIESYAAESGFAVLNPKLGAIPRPAGLDVPSRSAKQHSFALMEEFTQMLNGKYGEATQTWWPG